MYAHRTTLAVLGALVLLVFPATVRATQTCDRKSDPDVQGMGKSPVCGAAVRFSFFPPTCSFPRISERVKVAPAWPRQIGQKGARLRCRR